MGLVPTTGVEVRASAAGYPSAGVLVPVIPTNPLLQFIVWRDVDGSRTYSTGDTVTLTFNSSMATSTVTTANLTLKELNASYAWINSPTGSWGVGSTVTVARSGDVHEVQDHAGRFAGARRRDRRRSRGGGYGRPRLPRHHGSAGLSSVGRGGFEHQRHSRLVGGSLLRLCDLRGRQGRSRRRRTDQPLGIQPQRQPVGRIFFRSGRSRERRRLGLRRRRTHQPAGDQRVRHGSIRRGYG